MRFLLISLVSEAVTESHGEAFGFHVRCGRGKLIMLIATHPHALITQAKHPAMDLRTGSQPKKAPPETSVPLTGMA